MLCCFKAPSDPPAATKAPATGPQNEGGTYPLPSHTAATTLQTAGPGRVSLRRNSEGAAGGQQQRGDGDVGRVSSSRLPSSTSMGEGIHSSASISSSAPSTDMSQVGPQHSCGLGSLRP